MPSSLTSVGEPESSQHTPMKNTTPPAKRQRLPKLLPQQVKKTKLNQCQTLANGTMWRRVFEDIFDANFEAYDNLGDEKIGIQDAEDENEELDQLIRELRTKSNAAKESNDHLAMVIANSSTSGNPDVPYYDGHGDDLVVEKCTKSHTKQVDAMQIVRQNIETIKHQIHKSNDTIQTLVQDLTDTNESKGDRERKAAKTLQLQEYWEKAATRYYERKEYWKGIAERCDQELEDTKRKLNQKVAEMKDQNEGLESTREALARTEIRVRELEREDNHKFKSWVSTAAKLRAKNSENQRLTDRVSAMEKELAKQREILDNKSDHILQLAESKVHLENRISSQQMSLASLEKTKESMKTKLSTQASLIVSKDRIIKSHETEITQLLGSQETSQVVIDGLRNDKASAETQTSRVQEQLDTCRRELGLSCQVSVSKNQKIESLQNSNKDLRRSKSELESMQTKLSTKLSTQASLIASQGQIIQSHVTDIAKLLGSHETNQVEIAGLRTDKASAECKTSHIQQQLDTCQEQLKTSQFEIAGLRTDKASAESKTSHIQQQLDTCHEQLEKGQVEIVGLRSDNTSAETKTSHIQKQLDTCHEQLKTSQFEIAGLRNNKSSAEAETSRIQEELDTCRKELGSSQEELGSCRKELGTSREELRSCRKELGSSQEELGSCRKELGTSREELRSCRKDLGTCQVDIACLRKDKASADAETSRIQEELDTCGKELVSSREELGTCQVDIAGLRKDKASAEAETSRIQEELDTCGKELGSSREELGTCQVDIAGLRKDIAGLRKDKASAEAETSRLQEQLGACQVDIAVLRKDKASAEAEKCRVQEQLGACQVDIAGLRKDKASMEAEKCRVQEQLGACQVDIAGLRKDKASREAETSRLQEHLDTCRRELVSSRSQQTCFLHHLMADSRRTYSMMKNLPKEVAGVCDPQDMLIFAGVQAEKDVLVRAQRNVSDPKALVIVQSEDRTRVMWHKNFSRYSLDMDETGWHLSLKEVSNEEPLDIRILGIDPYDLEEWMEIRPDQ